MRVTLTLALALALALTLPRQPAATPASNKRLLSPASSQKSGSSLVVRDTSPYELPDEPQA